MLSIQTIIHPTDFSERSEYAFHLACALARDYGARMIALHVWSRPTVLYGEAVPYTDDDYSREAEEKLKRLQPDGDVHLDYLLLEGDPAELIVSAAHEHSADLIVMGMHGRSGISRLLMGSTAEQVLRRAPCPVITLKTPYADAAEAKVGAMLAEAVR